VCTAWHDGDGPHRVLMDPAHRRSGSARWANRSCCHRFALVDAGGRTWRRRAGELLFRGPTSRRLSTTPRRPPPLDRDGWLHSGYRPARCGRLLLHRRPHQGHVHLGGENVHSGRGGGGAHRPRAVLEAPSSRWRTSAGARSVTRWCVCAPAPPAMRDAARVRAHAARRLQGAQARHRGRRLPPHRRRQVQEARVRRMLYVSPSPHSSVGRGRVRGSHGPSEQASALTLTLSRGTGRGDPRAGQRRVSAVRFVGPAEAARRSMRR